MSKKTKAIIIGIVLVVVILGLVICFSQNSGNNANGNSYNNAVYDSYDETFGNNNDIITEPFETEAVTAQRANIEFVYDDIIYDKYGKQRGAIKINNCVAVYHDENPNNCYYDIYIDYEKVLNSSSAGDGFAIDAYVYDANGTPIKNNQVCYVGGFKGDEIGKKYKYTIEYVSTAATRIEFVGGWNETLWFNNGWAKTPNS